MSASHPAVHPAEPAGGPPGAAEEAIPRGRTRDAPGMGGTPGGLALRLCQFAFAAVSLAVMASTSDFLSVTAFCYLVAATGLQSLWSLSLAIVDVYAILVKRSLRNFRVVTVFAIGDGSMSASHPAVHPAEPAGGPPGAAEEAIPRGRTRDAPGMGGTPGGLALRLCQFAFAAVSLAVMASTSDFLSVTAFCYLVAATGLQSLWSLSLAIVDVYAILVKRSLRNFRVVTVFAIGDGITSTLTFSAACASAGITVLIGNDMNECAVNHCVRFQTATAMGFLSWFVVSPSFLLNFWTLASK